MILSGQGRVFRLQEEIFSLHNSGGVERRQRLPHARLKVMAALVRGIDSPEALAHSQFREIDRTLFLPGSTVQKIGKGGVLLSWHRAILPRSSFGGFPTTALRRGASTLA